MADEISDLLARHSEASERAVCNGDEAAESEAVALEGDILSALRSNGQVGHVSGGWLVLDRGRVESTWHGHAGDLIPIPLESIGGLAPELLARLGVDPRSIQAIESEA